jgi:hypothetical protein
MSHKILIELDDKQEAFIRQAAERNHISVSEVASGMLNFYISRMEGYQWAIHQAPIARRAE